jgi:hypothetical protein
MLAGVAPIEASSGRVVRHRLNRGEDRELNRALHTIVMIRRCLKRTVAGGLLRLLTRTVLPTTGPVGHGAWRPALPR